MVVAKYRLGYGISGTRGLELTRGMFAVLALCAAAVAAPAGAPAHPKASPLRQEARLTPGTGLHADRVIVLKSERRMVVLQDNKAIRVYHIALGRYPVGPKRRAGDARTPEGEYTLDYKLEDSAFYRAIHISYPNSRDIARAEAAGIDPGGKIMIHGLPNHVSAAYVGHPKIDWTQGCIAVTDREMDELWKLVDVGTPIDIYP